MLTGHAQDQERRLVALRGITWRERLRQMGTFGQSGGHAGDRRAFVAHMALVEPDGPATARTSGADRGVSDAE